MDRRKFIGTAAMATAAMAAGTGLTAAAGEIPANGGGTADSKKPGGLLVRFLGTGAADWNGPDGRGEHRRLTSVLIDNTFLIDYTPGNRDMLPKGLKPETIFYTHSHPDHYNPHEALALGIRQVFVSGTILQKVIRDFQKASSDLGLPEPAVTSFSEGASIRIGEVKVTALPANHFVTFEEQTQMYLLEKGGVRLLYATDTGGIPAKAVRLAGIDAHDGGKPITALIMEATMGLGHEDDYRIYTHSSVATVHQIWRVLSGTGRYAAPPGQPVYLTHMARTLHGTQAELDSTLPAPLKAAYDGLEVRF